MHFYSQTIDKTSLLSYNNKVGRAIFPAYPSAYRIIICAELAE